MIKTVIGLVANVGVSQVVNNIVVATTPTNLTRAKKIATVIGSVAVSTVLTQTVTTYMDEQIDTFTTVFNKTRKTKKVKEVLEDEA